MRQSQCSRRVSESCAWNLASVSTAGASDDWRDWMWARLQLQLQLHVCGCAGDYYEGRGVS